MLDKKYYWLKLKEDFFDEKYIKALRKLPDGDALTIVYLKMQLKSLKTEGIIQYEHILPSAEEELALVLDEDVNTVRLTLSAILNMGLVEKWENDTLYMVAMQNLIGSETAVAERVRKHREKQKMLQPPKQETKTNAERQRAFRAKKVCEEKQHIPFIEDYSNNKRYGGNYYIVMKRDKFKCSVCGSIENLCVHHIDGYDEYKPENNFENKMIVLCRCCHRQVHEGVEIPKSLLESIDYFENNDSNELCNTDVTNCNTYIEIEKRDKIKDIEYFSSEKLNEIFSEFLQMRKKIKAVNSDRAINTIINKLNKYDDDIKYKMIENSIVNSWKDVYELKQNKKVVPNWIDKEITNEKYEKIDLLAELEKE